MAVFEIEALPSVPSAAATQFYAKYLPLIAVQMALAPPDLTVVFPAADHTHRGWRLAAIQSLAREFAPARINGISGGDGPARLAAVRYLEAAPGLTGQYLPLDSAGAGAVIPSTA